MINWLMEQQIVSTFLLVTLLLVEAKLFNNLGAKVMYSLWGLVPLLIIANNLPQNVIAVDDNSIYRYMVEMGAPAHSIPMHINWLWLWLSGCIGVLSLGLIAQWKIYRLAKLDSFEVNLAQVVPKKIKVLSNKQLSGPLLSGIFNPVLLLPENFLTHFSARQQQLMIHHELVHFHRNDNIYNLFSLMFVAVFWFNPLSWFAYRAFRRSQELACDAEVLKLSSKDDQINYSKAVVQCAERSLHSFSIYSPYTEKHTMFTRIKSIQTPAAIKPALIGLSIALSSTLLAGVALANLADTEHSVEKGSMAMPVTRIEPLYPIEAAKNKQEGSVILEFDISKTGTTENIRVIESFPKQVFDKVSVASVEQWTYKPRIQGGKA